MVFKKLPKIKSWQLSHKNPEVFVMSQWQKKPKSLIFLTYRVLLAILFAGILTYSITHSVVVDSDFDYWFIYLTNNGLLICTICTIYAAFLVILYQFDWIKLESESISYKVFWLLSNVAIVLAFVISLVYWVLLFEWDLYYKGEQELTVLDFLVHGMNSIAMMLELFVVLHPMYLLHVIYSLSIGLLYLVFTLIYYAAGGVDKNGNNFIYKILNWENPGPTMVIVVGVIVLAVLLHFVACFLQLCRVKLHKLVSRNQEIYTLP